MNESTSFRTYRYGTLARHAIDSAAILMPGISKSMLANTAIFHLIYDMNQIMKETPDMSVRQIFEKVVEPIRTVQYEDMIKVVTPRNIDQSPLDDFIQMEAVRTKRLTGEPTDVCEDDIVLFNEDSFEYMDDLDMEDGDDI